MLEEVVNFYVLPEYNKLHLATANNHFEDVLRMFSLSVSIQTTKLLLFTYP